MLKNDKRDLRKIITTEGTLNIKRTVLRPKNEEDRNKIVSITPLDIYFKMDDLPFKLTRQMMIEVAYWAQNQDSFKAASSIIEKTMGVKINSETIRQVAGYVGNAVFKKDTLESDVCLDNMVNLRMPRDKEGVLYIETDGAALNTRIEDENGSTWRENKLGMVFSSDNMISRVDKSGEIVTRILKREYTSYIGKAEDFRKYLFNIAVKNGYGRYKKTIVLGDGATWIRHMCDDIFPDAIQILDFFHLSENTYSFGKHIFRNDESKYIPWCKMVIKLLQESESTKVLKLLREYKDIKMPAGVVNLYTYITNNINKIDYKLYKDLGYRIGSGAIESGNKQVLQKRLKQAGMRWSEKTAQPILSLRSKEVSGLWNEEVKSLILSYNFRKEEIGKTA